METTLSRITLSLFADRLALFDHYLILHFRPEVIIIDVNILLSNGVKGRSSP